MCEGIGNVQHRATGVQRFHWRQCVSYGLMNWRVHFGIIDLVYKAPREHTFLYTGSSASMGTGLLDTRTVGIPKCHLL